MIIWKLSWGPYDNVGSFYCKIHVFISLREIRYFFCVTLRLYLLIDMSLSSNKQHEQSAVLAKQSQAKSKC